CFLCEAANSEGELEAGHGHTCLTCNMPLNLEKPPSVLNHMGSHIINENGINLAEQPCGLCGRPSPMCYFVLRRTAGSSSLSVDLKASRGCPHLKKFSLTAAGQSTATSPCSNTLLRCPECDRVQQSI
ncbi:hypothetical protein GGX14DRAFT_300272, partial [Mycena pura]